jgi:nitrogen fixation/metabolism regulation signal transduction histidine kinase
LASFSFHVPIFELEPAKQTATAIKHRATVNTMVFVFMSLLIEKQIFRLIESGSHSSGAWQIQQLAIPSGSGAV